MIWRNGHNLKRIQISRELWNTEVDRDYVPSRHVNLLKHKTTTDDTDTVADQGISGAGGRSRPLTKLRAGRCYRILHSAERFFLYIFNCWLLFSVSFCMKIDTKAFSFRKLSPHDPSDVSKDFVVKTKTFLSRPRPPFFQDQDQGKTFYFKTKTKTFSRIFVSKSQITPHKGVQLLHPQTWQNKLFQDYWRACFEINFSDRQEGLTVSSIICDR